MLLFGDPPYRERLVTFLSLRRDLAERAPDAEHFDLRYRGRIYAKRPGLPAAPVRAGGTQAPVARARRRRPSRRPPRRCPARRTSPARDPRRRPRRRRGRGRSATTRGTQSGSDCRGAPRDRAGGAPPARDRSSRRIALAKKKDRYIVGLDVGTHKICAIVAEITDEGRLDVIGIGQTESRGLRKGVVINLEATVDAIKRVLEEAELMAGVEIGSAYVGIAGTHIKGFNSRGVIAVSSKNRVIDKEDVRRVIDAAKAVSIPLDREILHVLPQEFVVDDQDGIGDPTGMTGTRLEVNVHVITCSTTAAQNTVTCVNRAGLEVVDTVLTQIAAAEACLTPDEKELGVAIVDIGGGTTDLAIFEKGVALAHGRAAGGRRALHERRGGGAAHARERGREDQEEARLRAHLDDPGGGLDRGAERRRPQAADHGAPGARRRAAGARRGDLPAGADGDPARRLRAQPQLRRRADRAAARSSRGCPRSRSRSSTCRCGAARPRASAGSWTSWRAPSTRRRWGSCSAATATASGRGLGTTRQAATGTFGKVTGRLMGWLSDFF